MFDPYEVLDVRRDAGDDEIRSAYRRHAKTAHPDGGGDADLFVRGQRAFELLLDPARRKLFDETGYDLQLADADDLQGLLVIETLVNEIVLDERAPGSFDPVADMRLKLADDIRKNRFQMREMEGHRDRLHSHIGRLEKAAGTDVLGYMLRARIAAIDRIIAEAATRIAATERAQEMLATYTYALDTEQPTPASLLAKRR